MTLFGIYGASGFGREVAPLVRRDSSTFADAGGELVFIDDGPSPPTINGLSVLSFDDFCSRNTKGKSVCLAIADAIARSRLARRCLDSGLDFFDIRAANSVVMDEVDIGRGAILCPFVTITSNVKIGDHFHANLYSYVAHDCVIGDFVTFAPGVHCNGNVVIEDHAYIGAGAIIKQGKPGSPLVIGRGAVVGMGAVVTRSVPPGITVVGNPARPMKP